MDVEPSAVPDFPIAYDAGKPLQAAAKTAGNFGYGAQWAGQGALLARAEPAAEMVGRLRSEMEKAMPEWQNVREQIIWNGDCMRR